MSEPDDSAAREKRATGRVSMAVVARRAGVSGQTVSRVVNDSPRVDPATRKRVEAAMAELGYRPHRAARALRTGRTNTIGIVVSTLATIGNSQMLQATVDAADQRGYAVLIVTARGAAAVAGAFDRLLDQGVDGAIIVNEATEFARAAGNATPLTLVLVDLPASGSEGIPRVASAHADGARAAVEHLLELGHRHIAHLTGPAHSYAATERERGWREAMAAAGLDAEPCVRGGWSAASGYESGMSGVLSGATAVFCANDQVALGLIRALSESGKRVPQDVSVVGFDDVPDAANFRPPLTTVRQDFTALADRAVAALVASMGGDAVDIPAGDIPTADVPAPLVIRASTARFVR